MCDHIIGKVSIIRVGKQKCLQTTYDKLYARGGVCVIIINNTAFMLHRTRCCSLAVLHIAMSSQVHSMVSSKCMHVVLHTTEYLLLLLAVVAICCYRRT